MSSHKVIDPINQKAAGLAGASPGAAFAPLVSFLGLFKNGPSLTLLIRSPFIPLTGSEPYGHIGQGKYPSVFSHLIGFSSSLGPLLSPVGSFLSLLGSLVFQKPDPIEC